MSSFFWEYGVEAFAERPSMQDLYISQLQDTYLEKDSLLRRKQLLKMIPGYYIPGF